MRKPIGRWLLGILFVAAGANHFRRPDFYASIMPPYVPWHRELVAVSGGAEIALGLLVLVPRTRRLAAWGLIALLVAVFPANIHMAQHPDQFPDIAPLARRLGLSPEEILWGRLPLQGLLILWAYRYTRKETPWSPSP